VQTRRREKNDRVSDSDLGLYSILQASSSIQALGSIDYFRAELRLIGLSKASRRLRLDRGSVSVSEPRGSMGKDDKDFRQKKKTSFMQRINAVYAMPRVVKFMCTIRVFHHIFHTFSVYHACLLSSRTPVKEKATGKGPEKQRN
jgi:hypothetical protein